MKNMTFWKWLGIVIIIVIIGNILYQLIVVPKIARAIVDVSDKIDTTV